MRKLHLIIMSEKNHARGLPWASTALQFPPRQLPCCFPKGKVASSLWETNMEDQ